MRRFVFVCVLISVVCVLRFASAAEAQPASPLKAPILRGRVLSENLMTELTWNAVPGAFEYLIERDSSPDFETALQTTFCDPTTQHYAVRDRWVQEELKTLYYRIKALPGPGDLTHSESDFSNVVALAPIDPTPEEGVSILITPTSLDFQTFIFTTKLVVRNMSGQAAKLSLWPNTPWVSLSEYGFWVPPWASKIVNVRVDRTALAPGLYRGWAIMFLTNASSIAPPENEDGAVEMEAQVAGPVVVAPLGPYFLVDDTPDGDGLIDAGESVNCQFKLINTDMEVEALDLTVRIVPQSNVVAMTSGSVCHVNNLGPMQSTYVPFSFTAAPLTYDCDSMDGPVFDANFLVLINDTFGYSWEQVVPVGVCAPLDVRVIRFEIDDDDQGVSATVPHTHNKWIECGEIIEARLCFSSNYSLHNVSLSLSDNQGMQYLPGGDGYSFEDVDDLVLVPRCGQVTPDRDFEFRALGYNGKPIIFTLTVEGSISPKVGYFPYAYCPVRYERRFIVNGPRGPEVTVTTTNAGPRASAHDRFAIHANLRNLGPVDRVVDLYAGVRYADQLLFFTQGSIAPQPVPSPFATSIYLPRKTIGTRRLLVFESPPADDLPIGELEFMGLIVQAGSDMTNMANWYCFDSEVVNVNY